MVNGHPNLVRRYLYMNMFVTTAILVLSAFVSTHLVAQSTTTRIYVFLVSVLVSLIGFIKLEPHFIKGSSGSFVTNLARLFVLSLPIF